MVWFSLFYNLPIQLTYIFRSFGFAPQTASVTVKYETLYPHKNGHQDPLRIVELGGPTDGKFDSWHMDKIGIQTVLE